MASTINLSGLNHFIKSVQSYHSLIQNFHSAMELLCKEAQEYAQQQYAAYGHSDIQVSYDNGGTLATITAHGEKIAFFEFGTGDVGNGTYPDETLLPISGVPITGKWEYYYPSDAKRTSNGVRGWFYKINFHKGNQAEAEMWKTAQFIKTRARIILQAYFKAGSGGK